MRFWVIGNCSLNNSKIEVCPAYKEVFITFSKLRSDEFLNFFLFLSFELNYELQVENADQEKKSDFHPLRMWLI